MTTPLRALVLSGAALLLVACSSPPVAPDWQGNAFSALKGFTAAHLNGNTRLADFELSRARSELSRTGRAALLARAELTHCALQVASLEDDHCASFQHLAADAGAPERAYAAYLTGQWQDLDAALLPEQHRAVVVRLMAPGRTAATPLESSPSQLLPLADPLARLVAAGVLQQQQRLNAADIELATETAASQGWRRPLLAWLGLQLKNAQAGGTTETAARLQRRIDLVLQTPPRPQ